MSCIKRSDIQIGRGVYVSKLLYNEEASRPQIDIFHKVIRSARKVYVRDMYKRTVGFKKPVRFVLRKIKALGVMGRCDNETRTISIEVNSNCNATIEEMALTVAHELVHADQYLTRRLRWDMKQSSWMWNGHLHKNKGTTYYRYIEQPWEVEAFDTQYPLADLIIEGM